MDMISLKTVFADINITFSTDVFIDVFVLLYLPALFS